MVLHLELGGMANLMTNHDGTYLTYLAVVGPKTLQGLITKIGILNYIDMMVGFFSQNVKKSNSDDCMRYVDMFPNDLKAPHGKDYIGPK